MFHPIGAFGPRVFSTRNPLIGMPDGYSPVYPLGAHGERESGDFDYRAGAGVVAADARWVRAERRARAAARRRPRCHAVTGFTSA